jgi:hypothetical protein
MHHDADSLIKELFAPLTQLRRRRLEEIEDALVALGRPAVPALLHALRTRRWSGLNAFLFGENPVRYVIQALGRIRDGRAYEPLIDVIRQEGNPLARHAVEALGAIGNRRAVPELVVMLSSRGHLHIPDAYFAAARALVRLSTNGDVAALCDALDKLALNLEESHTELKETARREVVERLVAIGHPSTIGRLLAHVGAEYVSPEVFVRFGPRAVPELVIALHPDFDRDAEKALWALLPFGDAAVTALRPAVPGPEGPFTSRCAIGLCLLGVRDDQLILPIILAVEQDWSRFLALQALARLLEQSNAPTLRTAIPILRTLSRHWSRGGSLAVSDQIRLICADLLARIEQETDTLKTVPVVAAPPPSSTADLPIVSPHRDS